MENLTEVVYYENVTVGNDSETWRPQFDPLYRVPDTMVALLSVFYGTISILAVVGNSLVMWIVATSRRMQNVTNCFIANLALADIVIGLFAIPFQFQAALLQRWNLPYFMCAFCPFVQYLSVNVSIFTLTAIAIDRHRAILNPLSARPSKSSAKMIITAIWIMSGVLAGPIAYALRVIIVEELDSDNPNVVYRKPFCINVHLSDRTMMAYRYVLVFLQYVTPLCIISCVYARMALKLWGSHAPGNAQSSRDANLMKNKKKVIKMLVIVVALFALCWLPLQTYQVLQDTIPKINDYKYINIIFFVCDWLAMSNSCYNPFIYGIYNEKFKREFRQRFPCNILKATSAPDIYDMDKTPSTHVRGGSFRVTHEWRQSNSNKLRYSTRCTPPNSNGSTTINNRKANIICSNEITEHSNGQHRGHSHRMQLRGTMGLHDNTRSKSCRGLSIRQPPTRCLGDTELFVFPGDTVQSDQKQFRKELWL